MQRALSSQTGGGIARTWGKGRPKEGAAAWTRPTCGSPAQGPMLSVVGEVTLPSMTLKGRHFRNFKPVHCEGIFIINQLGETGRTEQKQNLTYVSDVSGSVVWDLSEGVKCSLEQVRRCFMVSLDSPQPYLHHGDL